MFLYSNSSVVVITPAIPLTKIILPLKEINNHKTSEIIIAITALNKI